MEFLGFLEAMRVPMHEEHIAMQRWCDVTRSCIRCRVAKAIFCRI
jgi:hypothetical protein